MKQLSPMPVISRRAVLIGGAAAMSSLPPANALEAKATEKKHLRKDLTSKFDRDRFVEDCIKANAEVDGLTAVQEVLTRAVSDHRSVRSALGEPKLGGLDVLLKSSTLTIFVANWTPQMNLLPHNHFMWAQIGIFSGREDNILWRNGDDGIEAYGANCLFEGDVASLDADIIHSVTNPLLRFTSGIHIYGGDFFHTSRHQWDPETLEQQPSDGAAIRAMFDRENERFSKTCR